MSLDTSEEASAVSSATYHFVARSTLLGINLKLVSTFTSNREQASTFRGLPRPQIGEELARGTIDMYTVIPYTKRVAFINKEIEYKGMSQLQEMDVMGEHLASDDSSDLESMSDIEYSTVDYDTLLLISNIKVSLVSSSNMH